MPAHRDAPPPNFSHPKSRATGLLISTTVLTGAAPVTSETQTDRDHRVQWSPRVSLFLGLLEAQLDPLPKCSPQIRNQAVAESLEVANRIFFVIR